MSTGAGSRPISAAAGPRVLGVHGVAGFFRTIVAGVLGAVSVGGDQESTDLDLALHEEAGYNL
jgi:hypothetical protein